MRILVNAPGILALGKQGEHLVRELAFPEPAAWAAELGPGTAQLLASPPGGGRAYPVVLAEEDGLAVWRITAADTARPGYGRCELRWSVDGMAVKSRTYVTFVSEGLSGGCGCGTDNWSAYLERIIQAGADALNAASRAEEAAKRAEAAGDRHCACGPTAALAAQGLTAEVAGAAADAMAELAAGLPVGRSVTLTATGWTGNGPYTQTVAVAGVRADEAGQLVQVAPASDSRTAWRDAGAACTGQGTGTLAFTALEKPGGSIAVYVVLQEVGI